MEILHATQDWVRDNFSIKNKASGELISLPDSTEEPLKSMKIYGKTTQFTTTGKNKLPYPYYQKGFTKNGITFTDNGDGSISISGTAEADAAFFFAVTSSGIQFEAGKTYCIVTKISNVKFVLAYKDENGNTKYIGDNMVTSVIWSENYTLTNIYMFVPSGTTASNTVYPIIVEGTSYDGVWEPYTGGIPSPNPDYPQELVSVGDSGSTTEYVMGKNLLLYPYTDTTKTMGGITFTDNGDGSITINGTAAAGSYPSFIFCKKLNLIDGETYSLTAVPNIFIYCACRGADGKTKYLEREFTWNSSYEFIQIYVQISPGATISNLTVYPMLARKNSYDGIWEPYKKEQSLTLSTPNGLANVPNSAGGDYIDLKRGVYARNSDEYRNTGEPMSMFSAIANDNGIIYWNQYLGVTNLTPGNYRSISNAFRCSKISGDYRNVPYGCIFNVSEVNGVRHAYLYFSILISDTEYGTTYTKEKEAISAWLAKTFSEENPLIVKYPLAEPIETPLTDEEIQAYKALHTNYPNTTIYNSDGAVTEVEYMADTKNYIDNKIEKSVAELTAAILSTGGNI